MSAVKELDFGDGRNSVSLVKKVEANPAMVLVDREQFEAFYEEIAQECRAFVPDLSSASGRKEIASLAYKVARTKTAIDDAGKKLTEDKRKEIKVVDEARKTVRDRLDALKDEVRKPLTDWEAAEEARVNERTRDLEAIRSSAVVTPSLTAAEIEERIATLTALDTSPAAFQEFAAVATTARKETLAVLSNNLDRIRKEEADRAELARLRAEAAERERVEQERLAAERAERERVEAAQMAEERRRRAEEDERQRVVRAEQAARDAAEAAARERERQAEAAHAAELKKLRDEQEADRRRVEQQERERIAAERAAAEEAERRAADREHRGRIMGAAKEALMEQAKLSEAKAKEVVLAIAAGNVPNVVIRF